GAEESAGVRLADRHPGGLEDVSHRPGIGAPLVVQLALLGDVVEVQRIRVRLVGVSSPVANDDHVAAGAKSLEYLLGRDGLTEGWADQQPNQGGEARKGSRHARPPWL